LVKILKLFDRDPGSGIRDPGWKKFRSGIRDPGWKNLDPGSGTLDGKKFGSRIQNPGETSRRSKT